MRYEKYFLIVSLLLAFPIIVQCQDYIRMDYDGPIIYKPFNRIIVSKAKIIDSGIVIIPVINIVLDVDKYNLVRDTVLGYLPEENQHEVIEFGCFQIKVKTKDQIKFYYLSSLERSKEYFQRFLVFLKKENINSELYDEIQDYLQRIGG